jgi:hypothetical protein
MFIWFLLDKLTKLTTGTDVDDKLVNDLQLFFQQNAVLRASIFSVIKRGWDNKFDIHDDEWTNDVLSVIFDIIRAKSEKI